MKASKRLDKLPPYLFVAINKKIAEKRAKGIDVISFAIGDPDIKTPSNIIAKLCEAAHDPVNHRYPETNGLPALRKAIAQWYKRRFTVELDPNTEVLPLIGSKEGIGHLSFCYLDQGDVSLVPDPGYPVYSISALLAGGEPYYMPLREERAFLPDFDAIPADILKRSKMLWTNYPNNPTGAVAGLDFFKTAVEFAGKHDLLLCHDAPYTEVAFDGYRSPSVLQVPGAKDVCIEFHSFSKTYNMTGWRIGMAVGNAAAVNALFRFKSNLDSGIPQAIQIAAIEALSSPDEVVSKNARIIQKRRDKIIPIIREIGLSTVPPKASFYIWAKIPKGYTSAEFTAELLDKVNIAVTPGASYGSTGEGYIRLSLTVPDERFEEGIRRLKQWRPS